MDDQGGEGMYMDDTCASGSIDRLTELLNEAKTAAWGVPKMSIRENILEKIGEVEKTMSSSTIKKGTLKVGKKKSKTEVVSDNVVTGKRERDPPFGPDQP
jgi:hypothetical protein